VRIIKRDRTPKRYAERIQKPGYPPLKSKEVDKARSRLALKEGFWNNKMEKCKIHGIQVPAMIQEICCTFPTKKPEKI